jgi:Putative transposase
VPSEMRAVFRREQKLLYGILMQVAAAAVKDLCAQKRHLGALPGVLSVLHTWNGQLGYHPHVHLLITGGGITADGQHWEPARGEFLVPVVVLSRKIAAQFSAALKAVAPAVFADIPAKVWQREWVSFCKQYGQGNDAVLSYLSRYVFRTAISNARILGMDQTHVIFRWKDRGAEAWRTERLPGVEFLRRFLQHVLPQGFHRVRSNLKRRLRHLEPCFPAKEGAALHTLRAPGAISPEKRWSIPIKRSEQARRDRSLRPAPPIPR